MLQQSDIAKNWTCFGAFQKFALWDHLLAEISHHAFNRFVLDEFLGGRRREASTFLGVNYYGRARLNHFQALVPTNGVSNERLKQLGIVCDDMFERHPSGFGKLLKKFHRRYGLPLYITEHGAASSDEDFRIHDLKEHLCELRAAMNDGVDVRGFFTGRCWTISSGSSATLKNSACCPWISATKNCRAK